MLLLETRGSMNCCENFIYYLTIHLRMEYARSCCYCQFQLTPYGWSNATATNEISSHPTINLPAVADLSNCESFNCLDILRIKNLITIISLSLNNIPISTPLEHQFLCDLRIWPIQFTEVKVHEDGIDWNDVFLIISSHSTQRFTQCECMYIYKSHN